MYKLNSLNNYIFALGKKIANVSINRKFSSDTIYALSSGNGKCGVSVFRLSGPHSGEALKCMCKRKILPTPRLAKLCKMFDPDTHELIDHGLVLWFPAPQSFTGEDSTEFQVHGGPAVISAVATSLGKIKGLRPAEAGEFTKRAFLNGKMDLTEVEGLCDLIHAETEIQRKQALRQMGGDLSRLYSQWRQQIIKCAANVEAFIDFAEEDNIDDDLLENVNSQVKILEQEVISHLEDHRKGERLRDGVHIAIVGQPNVGKSSLLNTLCRRPAAIVSPIAGTTRDVIETALNIGGYPVLLSDTAGLRDSLDEIEKEGVSRAINVAESADIRLLLIDASQCVFSKFGQKSIFSVEEYMDTLGLAKNVCPSEFKLEKKDIVVCNKIDLLSDKDYAALLEMVNKSQFKMCAISCQTGTGIEQFVFILKEELSQLCGNPLVGSPSLTQARHRHHLQQCLWSLRDYKELASCSVAEIDIAILAENLRNAARELGSVTGQITAEDILDVIFKDFCIGK